MTSPLLRISLEARLDPIIVYWYTKPLTRRWFGIVLVTEYDIFYLCNTLQAHQKVHLHCPSFDGNADDWVVVWPIITIMYLFIYLFSMWSDSPSQARIYPVRLGLIQKLIMRWRGGVRRGTLVQRVGLKILVLKFKIQNIRMKPLEYEVLMEVSLPTYRPMCSIFLKTITSGQFCW